MKSSLKEAFNLGAMLLGGACTFVFGNGFVSELMGHHPMGTDQTLLCLGATLAAAATCYVGARNYCKRDKNENTPKPPKP